MPRTLPWLKNTQKTSSTPSTPSTTPKHKPHRLPEPPPKRRRSSQSPGATKTSHRPVRTPSTSPPPRPPTPPSPLHPSDAKWRLVEDEFYTTAQLFTQHLHVEEYRRMKREARERVRSGGVNGGVGYGERGSGTHYLTDRSNDKGQPNEQDGFRRNGTRIDDDEGAEVHAEDMVIGDKNLKALMFGMSSSRGTGMRSKTLQQQGMAATTNTKASLGYGNPSRPGGLGLDDADVSEYDSDDLDAPVRKPAAKPVVHGASRELPCSPPEQRYGNTSPETTNTHKPLPNRDSMNGSSTTVLSTKKTNLSERTSLPIPSILDDLSPRRTQPLSRHKQKPSEQMANMIPTVFL